MTGDRPSVTDPYLQPLLDAVGEFHVVIGVQDKMRGLILKAYQQGRARVIRDIAEEDKQGAKREVTVQFASIRRQLDILEQAYLRRLADQQDILLSPEQMAGVLGRVQEALLDQARKNRE